MTPRPMTSCRSLRKTPRVWGLKGRRAGFASHHGGVRWKPGPGGRGRIGQPVRAVPFRLLGRSRSGPCGERAHDYAWDPVSKQPSFKYAAVKLEKIAAPRDSSRRTLPADLDPGALRTTTEAVEAPAEQASQPRGMRVFWITWTVQRSEQRLKRPSIQRV